MTRLTPIRHRRRSLAASLVLALLAFSSLASAQEMSFADAVKAAQLYKFASFVGWPESAFTSPSMPIQLCVIGNPAVSRAVARAAAGQTVNGRTFAVRDVTPAEAGACHIVYLANVSAETRADLIASLTGSPVLTVTDDVRDAASRGIINFVLRDNRVRFEIDNAMAARDQLSVSSRLLVLAVSR